MPMRKSVVELKSKMNRLSKMTEVGMPVNIAPDKHISDRKQAEEALNTSEERYRTILESIEEGYFEVDLAGNLTFYNDSLCRMTGYAREELTGMNNREYTSPETAKRMYQAFNEIYRTGMPANVSEYEIIRKDGSTCIFEMSTSLMKDSNGEPVGFRGIVRDSTSRKRAEEVLRESEERYRQLVDHAPAGIFEVDYREQKFVTVNDVMCEYTGYTREEFLALNPFDILTEESKKLFMERLNKILAGKKVPETVEFTIRGKGGREFWVILNTRFIYEDDTLKGATVVVHDITERKRAEEAVRKSEENYRLLVNNATDGIFIAQNGRIKFPNPKTKEILGYSDDELAEIHYMDLIHPQDRKIVDRMREKRSKSNESNSIYSLRVINTAGKQLWAQVSSVPIIWEDQPATLNFVRDITQQKMAEKKLRETIEKLRKVTGATIQAMAQTVEVRDPYTAGHQKRVSNLARAIATEMGLSSDKVEGIRMAGNIHDIGKISVPAEILSKPGLLTDIEFTLIKAHTKVGYEILKGIEFPWDIAKVVLQHHERIDGSGYPQGLSGDDILLEARILAVADVVEAMVSHRPYRPALGLEKAFEEISAKQGVMYDSLVVEACMKVLNERNFENEYHQ
ncbi:MAG: PAS domain S-box protein [Deltaproteobacteria bacterium]|jgi:PAS domain S-box-containing protein/putative nucleotidyltransferase with HDIG domain